MNTLQTIARYHQMPKNADPLFGLIIIFILFGISAALQPKNRRRK